MTAEVGLPMKRKAFPLFTTISLILIFAANIFSQSNSSGDKIALLTRSGLSETKKTVNLYELEKLAFDLINDKRAANGLSELIWSEDVAKIARLHSQNMANSKFFSHKGLDGLTVDNRADSLGVRKWQAIGENIAYNRGFSKPAVLAVDSWMKSNGHRNNILNNSWNQTGIGIAVDANGGYYLTQVFMLRK